MGSKRLLSAASPVSRSLSPLPQASAGFKFIPYIVLRGTVQVGRRKGIALKLSCAKEYGSRYRISLVCSLATSIFFQTNTPSTHSLFSATDIINVRLFSGHTQLVKWHNLGHLLCRHNLQTSSTRPPHPQSPCRRRSLRSS